jgi:uncharacterized metal-binding protein YceD (DUF177 family)
MPDPLPVSLPLRTGGLSSRKPTQFHLAPDAGERGVIAALVGATDLAQLSFKGAVKPVGREDFVLEGVLRAKATQACVVTLDPVVTEIEQVVTRRYLADFTEPEGDEAEMPEDDTSEPLGDVIDPAAVMIEALALALPDYPRAPGAELAETVHAGPGIAPLRDSDLRPFAGLASLAQRLSKIEPEDSGGKDA